MWKQENELTPEAAQARMREAIYAAIAPSLQAPLHDALDIGCSVGVGTLAVTEATGLALVDAVVSLAEWMKAERSPGAVIQINSLELCNV